MPLSSPNPDGETPDKVLLRGYDEVEYKEGPAEVAAITPGMLCEQTGTGLAPHGTAGEAASAVVALTNRKHSKTMDDPYNVGDLVFAGGLDKNMQFYGLLADGQNISVAGGRVPLVSDGTGRLRAINTGGATGETDDNTVLEAVESVDNTAGDSDRIRVEVTN